MTATGAFVAIIGPDGAGKTTLAIELLNRIRGEVGYVHWIPPVGSKLPRSPGVGPVVPKSGRSAGALSSVARIMVNLIRFWAGYATSVRPILSRGGVVIADRWGYGYVGQPWALRYSGPPGVARLCVRMMPRPDLTVLLSGPPDALHARKPELDQAEIGRELKRWSTVPIEVLVLEAMKPVDVLASDVIQALDIDFSE